MAFRIYDVDGNPVRNRVVLDCSSDEIITEQSHKKEVDINNIIKRHGVDLIQKTNRLASTEFQFDDVTGNDFFEAMTKIKRAQDTFDSLPSQIRKEFDNSPAKYLDFVQNPENVDRMVDLGLAKRPQEPAPVRVEMVNAPNPSLETPPA